MSFFSSLFQHYKLYEFMFSTTQAEEIIGTDVSYISRIIMTLYVGYS